MQWELNTLCPSIIHSQALDRLAGSSAGEGIPSGLPGCPGNALCVHQGLNGTLAEVRWLEPTLGFLRGDRERVGARKQPSPHRARPKCSLQREQGGMAEALKVGGRFHSDPGSDTTNSPQFPHLELRESR